MEEQNLPKLLVSIEEANKKIERQLEKGRWLHDQIGSYEDSDKARRDINNWSRYNLDLLTKLFENRHIVGYIHFYHGDLTVHEMEQIIDSGDSLPDNATYRSDMSESISSLEGILERLELFEELSDSTLRPQSSDNVSDNPVCNLGDDVFVVHGHDEAAKLAMADFVRTFDLNPIILDEKANEGQTIIEKFEAHAGEAGYAIILLTPDDIGAVKDETNDLKPRARQNVILELGYFLGALGRERVCVLHKEKVELPSDIHGVLYVPMDNNNGWKFELAREMKQAKLPIDLNKLA